MSNKQLRKTMNWYIFIKENRLPSILETQKIKNKNKHTHFEEKDKLNIK